jgi:hypothetical protein
MFRRLDVTNRLVGSCHRPAAAVKDVGEGVVSQFDRLPGGTSRRSELDHPLPAWPVAQKGIRMQAMLPAATAIDLWEIAGLPYQNLPASIVMSPEDTSGGWPRSGRGPAALGAAGVRELGERWFRLATRLVRRLLDPDCVRCPACSVLAAASRSPSPTAARSPRSSRSYRSRASGHGAWDSSYPAEHCRQRTPEEDHPDREEQPLSRQDPTGHLAPDLEAFLVAHG